MGALLSALAGPLIGAVVSGLLGLVTTWLRSQQDQANGAQQVAAAVDAKTATTEAAIAQAEAASPHTQAGLVSSLRDGSF